MILNLNLKVDQSPKNVVEDIPSIFIGMCSNCGGDITSYRLELGVPCENCLPEIPQDISFRSILRELEKLGTVKNFRELYQFEKKVEEFRDFFKSVIGHEPWALQVGWARRVLSNQSFVALAPTGVGKTTFGMIITLFLKDKKSYIIMPTKLLSKLFKKRIEQIVQALNLDKKILLVSDSKSKDMLDSEDYDILITTSMFLARNEEKILRKNFDFIFVDDVDSYLRQPKNVERVLKLMGLSDEDISELKNILKRKYDLMRDRNNSNKSVGFAEISHDVSKIRKKIKGVLVLSSATAKARASTIRYFREIFGFEISPYASTLRNIVDLYINTEKKILDHADVSDVKKEVYKKVYQTILKLGGGGFVFVNSEYGKDSVYELKQSLESKGVKAVTYEEFNEKNQEKFRNGEIDVVIGISSLRNPLCRGIDMPDVVRYAVFAGVPRFVFSINDIDEPTKLLGLLISLRPVLPQPKKVFSYIESMRKYVGMRKEDIERYPPIAERIANVKKFIEESIYDSEILEKIRNSDLVPIRVDQDGRFKFVVADSSAYIQASGRTSRLYVGGLSKGISVLIVDDPKALNQLKKRLRLDNIEIEFKDFNEVKIKSILKEVDRDRDNIKKIIDGGSIDKISNAIQPPKISVFIVESPNKAGTIAKLIGKPIKRKINVDGNGTFVDVWEVSKGDQNINIIASGGHIFDLPYEYSSRGVGEGGVNFYSVYAIKKDGGETVFVPKYAPIKRCRSCGENFFGMETCPYCGSKSYDNKSYIVKAIQKLSLEADKIYIATDPDQEGEKIAWDVFLSIYKIGKEIHRAEYHEITKKAIFNAIENPRNIKTSLVKSQILRRTTDRWVGFVMSEDLQKKFDKIWLSAGRVQTPVLGWLIKREEEMKNKIGVFKFKNESLGISDSIKIENKEDAVKISRSLQKLRGRKRKDQEQEKARLEGAKVNVKIELVDKEEVELKPPAPFSTADMLKESSAKLGFSAPETMQLAQNLFEAGLITYHRTDSRHVSDVGISIAREYISENFSQEFFVPRTYEQVGAHECIRPSRNFSPEELSVSVRIGTINVPEKAIKLYGLIHSNFIASQMKSTKMLRGKIKTQVSWKTNGEEHKIEKESTINLKVVEDGWNKVLFIPIPNIAQKLLEEKVIEFETNDFSFSRVSPVPPYTHGTLIDEMKRKGIGRPSTWAYIIKTLIDRGYCIERSGYIIITNLGKMVYNYLSSSEKFKRYTSEEYTRLLEEKIDKVENDQESYLQILSELHRELFS
ncbi:MAG: reverse gyrase [Candidatus Calescibacterium sp.]|nr:reverse gyrase [Candidatus Calescibacterium sp.]MDW8087626.1 reverse gyrase [Candidatus Calescibacterium sp.]